MMDTAYIPEIWKKADFGDTISENEKYEISNYGRLKSFKQFPDKGMIVNPHPFNGYPRVVLKQKSGKRTARYMHKLVAELFIEKESEDQKYVIHLDYDKMNNHVNNLKWATKREKEIHQFNNPLYKDEFRELSSSKLTVAKVKLIKRKLNDPKRKTRMKMIAKQFGISEMQLYRIKSGENWARVKPD